MKILKIFLVILYLFIYGYSVYKTEVEPQRPVWGFICAFIFFIFAIWTVSEYVKYNDSTNNKN
jgi:uncharacterized membrane protein